QPASQLRSEAAEPAQAVNPEPVPELVDVERVQPGIAGEHLPARTRRRVALQDASDIVAQLFEHERILRVSDEFDQLWAGAFREQRAQQPAQDVDLLALEGRHAREEPPPAAAQARAGARHEKFAVERGFLEMRVEAFDVFDRGQLLGSPRRYPRTTC